ncbi:MAG: transposase [Nitrospirae bacterium]|nr:transposase [Nitrospirota bacterium]
MNRDITPILVGPRHLRGPKGVTRFYSFHAVDVAGHTVATSQFQDKQVSSLCRHLVAAWQRLGLPTIAQLDNEMAATGGFRYPYSLSQVVRLHLLWGIHLVFIPPGEPGRNATVESFNHLWQTRVLRRHPCPTLAALKRMDRRFLCYYHYHKPHRGLSQREHGTRFPGVLRDRQWATLRQIPQGVDLEHYRDSKGQLHFPLARGTVSFIRKVDPKGSIDVQGVAYFIRKKLSGQYVMATIFTHRRQLVTKQEGRTIKSFPFPHKESLVAPLLPTQRGKP